MAVFEELENDGLSGEISEKLVLEYLDDAVRRLDTIHELISGLYHKGDLANEIEDELKRQIHSLKGTAGSFGFPNVSQKCHQIETDMSTGVVGNVALLNQLSTEFNAIAASLQTGQDTSPVASPDNEQILPQTADEQSIAKQIMLSKLIYVSDRNEQIDLRIEELLGSARKYNSQHLITGALWFNGYSFLQILEGDRREICNLFYRIQNDPRHKNVDLMSLTSENNRVFDKWYMAYKGEIVGNQDADFQTGSQLNFDLRTISAEGLTEMLLRLVSNE